VAVPLECIETTQSLRELVRKDHIPPLKSGQISNGVKMGYLKEADFLAVWDQATPGGKWNLFREARPRSAFKKMHPKFRELWSNGKDPIIDSLWLSSFVGWEVRGEIPRHELVKFWQLVANWEPSKTKFKSQSTEIRDGLRMSQDAGAMEIAEKVGLKKKGEKLEMRPSWRRSFRSD